jgi:hypothetical protein
MIVSSFRKCAHSGCPENRNIEKKINRMGLSLQYLLWYADEEDTHMLNMILTGYESWVHHYQPESMHCKHPSSPCSKKLFKVTPSAGKVLLTVFWDSQRVLLAHFEKNFGMQFAKNVQAKW